MAMRKVQDDGPFVNVAKVVLMLINMGFLVAGCLLVYFSHRVKASGWTDAFSGDYAWIGDRTFLLLLLLGAVVMALATVGCFGAWLQNRLLLLIYAITLLVTAVLFAVLAIGAHAVKAKADDWGGQEFPANSDEESVGSNFNQLYCYAQVTYYCTATAADVASIFSVDAPSALLSVFTVEEICASSSRPSTFDALCDICALVDEYSKYAPVSEWAETACPRTAGNQVWCSQFLLSGEPGAVYADASPYSECRAGVFALVAKYSGLFFTISIVVCIATVLIFGFTWLVRRNVNRAYDDDSFVVDTPSPRY